MSDTIHGANFDLALPTITLNSDTTILGTTLKSVNNDPVTYTQTDNGQVAFTPTHGFIYFYDYSGTVPEVQGPVTVTITVPVGYVCNYTFGPQYPSPKVDYISCFKYSGPFSIDQNVNQDGTTLFVSMFVADSNGDAEYNDQSPLLIAKFSITPA